ncbi:hypothetical protein JH63_14785 [Listeria monocytogenes]|nr:hypothetical protein [Listeria monocytogenes]
MDTIKKWFKQGLKPKKDTHFEDKMCDLKNRMQKLNQEMENQLQRRECEGFAAYFLMQNEELVQTKEDHWLVG